MNTQGAASRSEAAPVAGALAESAHSPMAMLAGAAEARPEGPAVGHLGASGVPEEMHGFS